jgi:hypothetical protein
MLVHDHPLIVNPAVANGRAHPDIGLLPVRPRSTDPVEAMGERRVIARRDFQVANLEANRTSERG